MSSDIAADDEIARCLIHSKFFPGNIHTNAVLWVFDGDEESAVLRSKAPEDADVHAIGCSIAEHQNTNRLGKPARGDNRRRYYCAFRNARVADLILAGPDYNISLRNNHDAHVQVKIDVQGAVKSLRRTIKTDAGLELAEAFGELVFHRCECDEGDQHHPLSRYGEAMLKGGIKSPPIEPRELGTT